MTGVFGPMRIRWSGEFSRLVVLMVACGLASSFVSPYLALLCVTEVHMSASLYAAFVLVNAAAAFGVNLLVGVMSDRIGNRYLLLPIAAICGFVSLGAVALWPRAETMFLVYAPGMAVASTLFPQILGAARGTAAASPRGDMTVTVVRSLLSLSWIVGPPVAALIFGQGSITSLLMSASALYLVCVAAGMAAWWTGRGEALGPRAAGPSLLSALRAVTGNTLVLIVSIIGIQAALAVNGASFALRITQELHGSLVEVGLLLAIGAAIEIPAMLAWGWLATRRPRARLLMLASVGYGTYMIGFALLPDRGLLLPLAALAGLFGSALLSLPIVILQAAMVGQPTFAASLVSIARICATALGAATFGLCAPLGYDVLLGVGASYAAAATLILFAVQRTEVADGASNLNVRQRSAG